MSRSALMMVQRETEGDGTYLTLLPNLSIVVGSELDGEYCF